MLWIIFKKIFKTVLWLLSAALLAVVFLLAMFNWPVKDKNVDMKFGISFSHLFARDIGLDWKKAYTDIIDQLGVKRLRLGAYWTEIEKEKGTYDFSDLDFQLDEARKRKIDVILAFGIKAPRWPECFIPDFYGGNPTEQEQNWDQKTDEEKKRIKQEREAALLVYEKALIERYKDYENIKMWQVENEPFLPFGHCVEGAIDEEIVDREIAQTKQLDPDRRIMVTDSGELSLWYQAAKRGDVFGTTLYRIIHKEPFGYIPYPLSPNFFRMKATLVEILAGQYNIIISELQAEPWGPGWLPNLSVEEQYKSMNPVKFRDIVDYAKKTNFSESYLWGAEWWYWLKETKGKDEMWNEAKKLLSAEPADKTGKLSVKKRRWSSLEEYEKSIDRSCETDADCVIKDMHNCCGYYPVCANKEAETNPDFVRNFCIRKELAAVCGYPVFDSCRCRQGTCDPVPNP